MPIQISLRVPDDIMALTGRGSAGRAAQHALRMALDGGVPLASLAGGGNRAVSVYLSDADIAAVKAVDEAASGVKVVAENLIYSWARKVRRRRPTKPTSQRATQGLPTSKLRPEQMTLLTNVLPHLAAGAIAYAEASTGVGKSRALAVMAARQRSAGKVVTISTASISLMSQLAREFEVLGEAPPALYLGRHQFVDPELLKQAIGYNEGGTPQLADDDAKLDLPPDQYDRLVRWIESGGKPPAGNTSTASLVSFLPNVAWLLADLEYLAPTFPVALVANNEDGDEDGEPSAYQAMRQTWLQAPVRVCCHSLLAVHIRLAHMGRDVIAPLDTLLVDEAHLLYPALEGVYSGNLSLFSLKTKLFHAMERIPASGKLDGLTKKATRQLHTSLHGAIKSIHRHTLALSGLQLAGSTLYVNVPGRRSAPAAFQDWLLDMANDLVPALNTIIDSKLSGTHAACQEAVAACRRIQGHRSVTASLSPKLGYPSISTGQPPSWEALEKFWQSVGSACLTSGTLYTDTAAQGISAAYFSHRLRIPASRIKETPRVVASWVMTTPTVHLPSPDLATRLCPVNASQDAEQVEKEAAYYTFLANACQVATDRAAGGTLVLSPGYYGLQKLAELLLPRLGSRLLVQRSMDNFQSLVERFRAMQAQRERPVWLATGPAWTGLDLRETKNGQPVPAANDRLLTDVIIARLPLMPKERGGAPTQVMLYEMAQSACLRFRQGIGRLVRAEGQPDRHLWVLDGRLTAPGATSNVVLPCKRVLMHYPNRETIEAKTVALKA